jgi:hypothetical protein
MATTQISRDSCAQEASAREEAPTTPNNTANNLRKEEPTQRKNNQKMAPAFDWSDFFFFFFFFLFSSRLIKKSGDSGGLIGRALFGRRQWGFDWLEHDVAQRLQQAFSCDADLAHVARRCSAHTRWGRILSGVGSPSVNYVDLMTQSCRTHAKGPINAIPNASMRSTHVWRFLRFLWRCGVDTQM